jgi:ribonuclease J
MTNTLRIIPLGGLGEIGKNMTLYESGRNIVIVDAGMMIPEHDMWGIDLVIPDYSYLRENADAVRGIVITHGHEDHIGGLPYLLRDVLPAGIPMYATRLACGLIESKLGEHHLLSRTVLKPMEPGESVRLGPLEIESLAITHSIPDGVGLALTSDVGTVIHTGDFKFDYTPVHGGPPDFSRLGQLGAQGVLALLSDSTGAERAGYTPSEQVIEPAFEQIFRDAPGRIIVATFASLLSRVQQVINAAQRHGRVVALAGYSMLKTAEIARDQGYLDVPPGVLVDLYETRRLPDDGIAIVTTGSQGQPEAALARMAEGSHRQIEIKPGDTVVLSSNPIPGNEEEVARVINKLFARGANVIYPPLAPVHVSGHASQEEDKLMLSLTRPRFFVPIHGELRHLYAHARLAQQLGIQDENIFILENGSILELTEDSAQVVGKVTSGNVFVDGAGVGDIGPAVMREREVLARDGFVIAVVPYSEVTGEVSARPDLVSRGFVYMRDEGLGLMERAAERVWQALKSANTRKPQAITEQTQGILSRFFYEETGRKPMVIVIVTKV